VNNIDARIVNLYPIPRNRLGGRYLTLVK